MRVSWTYDHSLNGRSSVSVTKQGEFRRICWRKGRKCAQVRFDGNKTDSFVPLEELDGYSVEKVAGNTVTTIKGIK